MAVNAQTSAANKRSVERILNNLAREIKKVNKATEGGLLKAAMHLMFESQNETPVVTGNLRRSAYVTSSSGKIENRSPKFQGKQKGKASRDHSTKVGQEIAKTKRKKQPEARVGYSAVYALAVHENPRAGKTGGVSPSGRKYSGGRTTRGAKSKRAVFAEKGKWKFLEDPLKREQAKLLKIIAGKAKIK